MDDSAKIYLGVALMLVMFGMGLTLRLSDFKRVVQYPNAVLVGVLNQIVLLPIIGLGLIEVLDVNANIAVGIMLLSACPGGPTSNLITHLSKGDVALSVTLTAICSIITIFTIPFIVSYALQEFSSSSIDVEVSASEILKTLIAVILIPITIGMIVLKYAEGFAQKMEKPMKIFSSLVLVAVIVGLVLKEKAHFVEYFKEAGFIALSLNVATMLVGYISAKLVKLEGKQAITIAIESGNQNGTLAITIALAVLMNSSYAIAPAVYSLIMFLTAGVVIGARNLKRN